MAQAADDKDDHSRQLGYGLSMLVRYVRFLVGNKVKNIDTITLADWLKPESNTDVILLDTRPEVEFRIGHIAGSQQIDWESNNMEELVKKMPDLKSADDKKKVIVCCCSIGYRASIVAEKLQKYIDSQESIPDVPVYNVEGSLFKWATERRPLVDSSNQKTTFVHPLSTFWGWFLDKDVRGKMP